MGIGPYRPAEEIKRHLDRGELEHATAIAKDLARNTERPLPLNLALCFLPVICSIEPESYDRWAARWLTRWINETPKATIERITQLAAALAELPLEPTTLPELKQLAGIRG